MNVTESNFDICLEILKRSEVLAWDTETTSLNSFQDGKLFSVIISCEQEDFYFNFKDYPEENVCALPTQYLLKIVDLAQDNLKINLMQNAKFDMHMLAREGIFFAGKIYDTAVLDRVHFNQHMRYNLAEITKRWGDEKLDIVWKYIEENKLKTKTHHERFNKTIEQPHFDRVPFSIIQPYGEQDGAGTLNVGKQILAKIQQDDKDLDPRIPKQMQVVENEARLTKTLFNMEHRGIQLDLDYCNEALDHYLRILQKSEIAFKNLTGLDFVKGTTVFEEVFASEKDKWEKTEKGNWKWDADVLETFENPAAKLAIEWAEAKKQSEYFANFLFYCDSKGVLHPDFQQGGTVTGRLSCRDPNLQNLTNPDKYEEQTEAALYPVRRSFIPRPGYFFAMLDFQQVEFRLALDYANANSLIREVINGHDVHTATAQLAGISRKEAKTVNFLCIAEDQLVLTNQGLIPIQNVTTSHKVWDGVEWVSHDGVIFKGEAECIDYEGLIATEDHEVFTEKGWKVSIRDLTRKQNLGRIVVTESKGSPIRFSKTIRKYSKKNWEPQMEKETSWIFSMLCLLKNQMDKLGEYIQRLCQNMQMYEYQAEGVFELRSESSKEAPRKILSGVNQMLFTKIKSLSQLWGKGYSSEMLFERMERVFLKELFRGSNNEARHRPNRQRRTLRNRELATCDEIREFKKSTKKVYDILNAGPRNRFTVSGKLVSNCIYGGGVVKLAQNLYETKGSKAQLGAIYKKMFGWRLSDEEQRAWPTVTDELRQFNEPVIRKAYDVQQSVFRAAPEIKDFLKAVQRAAETRGYVRNYLGRRYYFTDKRWSYKAPNHLIQGSAADIIKTAMNKVDEYLKDKKSKMLLSIHDELVVEVRYGEEFVVDEIKKIMQGIWVNRRLPLLVDVEWSEKNLADKQDWSSENFSRVTETRNNIQSKVEIST